MAHHFLENRDIVLFALKSWDMEIGGSSKNYASVFARNNNRVIFVNRALDRFSVLRNRQDPKVKNLVEARKTRSRKIEQVEKNIWVLNPVSILESINSIPWPWAFDAMNRLNSRRLAREINEAAAELGFKNIILYVENDFLRGIYLDQYIRDVDYCIFYIRDFLTSQNYFKKHGPRLEPKMIAKADIVITNSNWLADYARRFNKNSYFVGQGVDLKTFKDQEYPMPAGLEHIPGPIIGYVGAILATRLDPEIIKDIAERRPEWNIVLVGPEDKYFEGHSLHQMKNVYFLGRKDLPELPAYIKHFDVCINPQLVNEMTIGNYPLKADEYLALGKPMVATRTEAMKMFEDFVHLCDQPLEYVGAIEKALAEAENEDMIMKRKAFARSHTWESCFENLDRELNKIVGRHDHKKAMS